jgi:hypothetical protein
MEREHIWAINADDRFDSERLSEDQNKKVDYNKRRLGNFTLLRRTQNSLFNNETIEDKIEKYKQTGILCNKRLEEYYQEAENEINQNWQRATANRWIELYSRFLDRLEESYVRFALKEWAIGGQSKSQELRINTLRAWSNGNNHVFSFEAEESL